MVGSHIILVPFSIWAICVTGDLEVQTDDSNLPQINCKYDFCPPVLDGKTCERSDFWSVKYKNQLEYTCLTNTNVTLNDTYPYFRFNRLSEENQVVQVIFRGLTMHTFTNDTCVVFPSLQSLHITEVMLEVILPNALTNCSLLTRFSAVENQLLQINAGTFTQNPQLDTLVLQQNNISIIDPNAFDNTDNLRILDLMHNRLQRFPDVELSYMNKLNMLILISDYIKELNIEEILTKMPNLQSIYICEYGLTNYDNIKQQFESRNVQIVCPRWFPAVKPHYLQLNK